MSKTKQSAQESLSKRLTYVLRHQAINLGLPIKPDGFVSVDAILKHQMFSNFTLPDILKVVEENDKQRFFVQTNESGVMEIRANQGHSMSLPELDLQKISDPRQFPVVVHGTTKAAWLTIQHEGLKKMSRTHIHFARGLPGDNQVISGMRSSSQVVIYVDLAKALNDNIEFYLSANDVVLCKGIGVEGVLPPKYFSRVVDAKTSVDLEF